MAGRWDRTSGVDCFRFFSPEQVDQILCEGARRGRAGSHAAIERILKLEPGIERAELWQRIRQLKYPSNGARYRRIVWSADDDQILSRGYEKGWSGKQEAVRELLKRHPDWRPHLIWRRAAKLHLTRKTPKRGQERSRLAWSEDDDRILLNLAGYKTSRVLAKILHRSEVAVRYRLMVLGKSSRVHLEGFARHALARDLHVASSTIQRLIAGGLLEVRDPRITRESLDNLRKSGRLDAMRQTWCAVIGQPCSTSRSRREHLGDQRSIGSGLKGLVRLTRKIFAGQASVGGSRQVARCSPGNGAEICCSRCFEVARPDHHRTIAQKLLPAVWIVNQL